MSRRLVDGKVPEGGNKSTGVPSLLEINPDLAKRILNSVRMGNYIAVAARQYGVNPITIQRWIAKGMERPDSLYGAFSQNLDQALAEAEARDLASLDAHANGRPIQYERHPEGAKNKKGESIAGQLVLIKGKPVKLADEIKSDWKAALAKMERRNRKRWGVTDLAQSASEQELPPTRDVTPEQKTSVMNRVREKLAAIDELAEELGDD